MIKKVGLFGTSFLLTIFIIILSFLVLFLTNFIVNRELTLVSLFLAVVIPLVIFPFSLYIFLGLFKKIHESEQSLLKTNKELEKALKDVKELSGMLPICASCKKIRDDNGYWSQVEEYISNKTDVVFSHSLCPTCYQKESDEIDDILKKRAEDKLK
jgi:ABC-type multidrug transport system fused ATPase/permease subunit